MSENESQVRSLTGSIGSYRAASYTVPLPCPESVNIQQISMNIFLTIVSRSKLNHKHTLLLL